ncbi:hypothetical protein J2Y48_004695 [Mycoplana sp. BE70]|nr:hypothetical protein [Mycoplana sp. BE70]
MVVRNAHYQRASQEIGLEALLHLLDGADHARRMLDQFPPVGAQRAGSHRPLEQLLTEMGLEAGDLVADGGLREIQPLGRLRTTCQNAIALRCVASQPSVASVGRGDDRSPRRERCRPWRCRRRRGAAGKLVVDVLQFVHDRDDRCFKAVTDLLLQQPFFDAFPEIALMAKDLRPLPLMSAREAAPGILLMTLKSD